MAAIIIGVGVGCFMFAYVSSRYNETTWANSRYFWGSGAIVILIGLILLLI